MYGYVWSLIAITYVLTMQIISTKISKLTVFIAGYLFKSVLVRSTEFLGSYFANGESFF